MTHSKFSYKSSYSVDSLRGRDITPRPDLVPEYAKKFAGPEKHLLDIGCGNFYKTLPLAEYFKTVVGVDPSSDLILQGQDKIHSHGVLNAKIIRGVANPLPKFSNDFDVVITILAFWDAKQVYKIMNKNGTFLIESLGPDDKTNFTQFFGRDNLGWRGVNIGKSLSDMQIAIQSKLEPYFDIINVQNQTWQTEYTQNGLWALLNNTFSTVRNFNPSHDKQAFEKACKSLEANGSIQLNQNRLVIEARPR